MLFFVQEKNTMSETAVIFHSASSLISR